MPSAPPIDNQRANSRWFSLPNLLSLSRIPLGGAFWLVLETSPRDVLWPFVFMAAAAGTDVLDGHLARLRHTDGPTGVGSWLDPICDKLFVALVLAAIFYQRRPPLTLLALILSREIIQLPMTLVYRFSPVMRHWLHYDFRASVLGKAATVAQFLAVAALLLELPIAWGFAWAAFAVGVTAIADYIRRAVMLARSRRRSLP